MKSAQIIESSGKSAELKGSPGLFECLLEHEVKATKATFDWTGPKLTPAMWHEVLAFFRWTQDTEKSESQVRLFVHPQHGWMAWAFPQKGGTSMTTKEVENDESRRQRRECIPEGYLAFGTVHHHCTMAAFQSGTDTHDEKSVDGLHITVGNLDAPQYSLHCRIYLKGHKFEPNLAAFWDIGEEMRGKVAFVEKYGYGTTELEDKVARQQLGVPAPAETAFNPVWKDNYLLDPPIGVVGQSFYGRSGGHKELDEFWRKQYEPGTYGFQNQQPQGKHKHQQGKYPTPAKKNPAEVLEELEVIATYSNISKEDLLQCIIDLGDSQETEIYQAIAEECIRNDVKLEQLFDAAQHQVLELLHEEAKTEAQEDKNNSEPMSDAEAYGYMQ